MQQQVSTPSIVEILDSEILASNSWPAINVTASDYWDSVLSDVENFALDPATSIAAMDSSISAGTLADPYVTQSFVTLKLKARNTVIVANSGSADYLGNTEAPFNQAIADGAAIIYALGSFLFSTTLTIPDGVVIKGVHPNYFLVGISVNLPAFFVGKSASLSYCTVYGNACVSKPVVQVAGGSLNYCNVTNVQFLGVQLSDVKSRVSWCMFTATSGSAVWSQNKYQVVENCLFIGAFSSSDGIVRFESSESSAIANVFGSTNTGAAFVIPSARNVGNKLVANSYNSPTSLAAAVDNGTGTIRYANIPNTMQANQNNPLAAVSAYVGQASLSQSQMVLTSQFAHTPATDKDATAILGSLDNTIKLNYEERSWFLISDDPTFDLTTGVAQTGIFSWDGSTLTWPDFTLISVANGNAWPISSGSLAVGLYQFLMVNVPRTSPTTPLTPIISNYKELTSISDSQWVSLAWSPAAGSLIWVQGFRLLTGMPSFDVDGMALPIARFVNFDGQDPRNSLLPTTPTFAGANGANVTSKIGSQSALLKEMFDKSNLRYIPDADASFSTETVTAGDWITSTETGLPERPSHICQCQGSAYALCPNNGLYRWERPSSQWTVVLGNTVSQYAAMSYLGTGLALLEGTGNIYVYNPDGVGGFWPAVLVPTFTPDILTSLVSSYPLGYVSGGQADYALQTSEYTLFTTISGDTLLFYHEANALKKTLRVFSEVDGNLWSYHERDTGFNVMRDPYTFKDMGTNGVSGLTPYGLPLGQISQLDFYPTVLPWDTFQQILFDFDPVSKAFMCIYKDSVTSAHYFISGGQGSSRVLGEYFFTTFTPHCWFLDWASNSILVVGKDNATASFSTMSAVFDGNALVWAASVIGTANDCQGTLAAKDSFGSIHCLVSDPSRGNRPTWWTYSSVSGWSSYAISTSANGFNYIEGTDLQAGSPLICPYFTGFFVKDGSRANRPTLYYYNGTYNAVHLDESVIPEADPLAVVQGLGALYIDSLSAAVFLSFDRALLRAFIFFCEKNAWYCDTIGFGGDFLSTTHIGTPSLPSTSLRYVTISVQDLPESNVNATADFYIYASNVGVIKGTLLGNNSSGLISSAYILQDARPTGELFSQRDHSYTLANAVARNDLSLQFRSFTEKLPPYGISTAATVAGKAVSWFDSGTKVKNPAANVWVGLNRGGYLWIAVNHYQKELTPGGAVRGDIIVTGLDQTSDYDCTVVGNKLALCYRSNVSFNFTFLVYDITAESVDYITTVPATLGSTPRLLYSNGTWIVVAQDESRDGGQLVYYTSPASSPAVWVTESVIMAANTGRNPTRAVAIGNDLILAAEDLSFNSLVWKRDAGVWSTIATLSGLMAPILLSSTTGYWLIGNNCTAWSSFGISAWNIVLNYQQALSKSAMARADDVLLAIVTSIYAVGVFSLNSSSGATGRFVGAFSTKGSSLASGDEEQGITDVSWTPSAEILYSAQRPLRDSHWTRINANWDTALGESMLGTGRGITIDRRHFREQWWYDQISVVENGNSLGEYLPLALRDQGSLFNLRWPWGVNTGPLFYQDYLPELSLATGGLPASLSRAWPLILGSTTLNSVGSSTVTWGSFLGLYPPIGETDSSYFGASLPFHLFKLQVPFTLTLDGTHVWSTFNRSYTQSGPITFTFDPATAVGAHLVLWFSRANSLVLDSSSAALSYWQASNHDETNYAVVIGEVRSNGFLIYPNTFLTFGALEPRELLSSGLSVSDWCYRVPKATNSLPYFEIIPITDTKFSIKNMNFNPHGFQGFNFASISTARQLLHRGWYYFQVESALGNLSASTDVVISIVEKPFNILVFKGG